MKYKGIIYTVITGGYDTLRRPLFKNKDWLYVLLTDKMRPDLIEGPNAWDEITTGFDSTVLEQRYEKITMDSILRMWREHPEYFVDNPKVIYHDGKLQQTADINPLANLLQPEIDLVVKKHPHRHCLYAEAEVVSRAGLANAKKVKDQITRYRQVWDIPSNAGLIDSCILVRWLNPTPYLKLFYDLWFEEVRFETHRDQISFNYVLWQHPLRVKYYREYTPWFIKHNHRKRK